MNNEGFFRLALKLNIAEGISDSAIEIQLKILEYVFFDNYPEHLPPSKVKTLCKEMGISNFTEEEIEELLSNNSNYIKYNYSGAEEVSFNLRPEAYSTIEHQKASKTINHYIEEFYCLNTEIQRLISKDEYTKLIDEFLYKIANTNLLEFQRIASLTIDYLGNGNTQLDIQYDSTSTKLINNFLNWNKPEKNELIYRLASIGLEFSVLSNPNNFDLFSKLGLKRKKFFLDTNIIYRLLGLNGKRREARIIAFIDNCKKTGQEMFISDYTEKEFFDSVSYHCQNIHNFSIEKPRVFFSFSEEEDFYYYYYKWKETNNALSIDVFKAIITGKYEKLFSDYPFKRIKSDIDLNDEKVYRAICTRAKKIAEYKREYNCAFGDDEFDNIPHDALFDSKNFALIDKLRDSNSNSFLDTEYFFITTDQKLQAWDNVSTSTFIRTILPSIWLSISIRFFGSAENDFKSFVNFINLSNHQKIISNEKLSIIMAAVQTIESSNEKAQEEIIRNLLNNDAKKIVEAKRPERAYTEIITKAEKAQKDLLSEKVIEIASIKQKQQESDNLLNEKLSASEAEKKNLKELLRQKDLEIENEVKRQKLEKKDAAERKKRRCSITIFIIEIIVLLISFVSIFLLLSNAFEPNYMGCIKIYFREAEGWQSSIVGGLFIIVIEGLLLLKMGGDALRRFNNFRKKSEAE